MKKLILYYSYTGKTKALAEKKAAEYQADIEEIRDIKRPSRFSVYTVGVFRALRRKGSPIQPIQAVLTDYQVIIIMSPVWASRTTPAINSALKAIPSDRKIEFIMVSAGGTTGKAANGTKALAYQRGCEVTEYTDYKA